MKDAAPPRIRIVPAGAGAGKTTEITRTLTQWLSDGTVVPERILAVTFTEAAAGELRERLRAAALEAGMTKAALGIERAYISTIHALGLRLTMEHALAAGTSPAPRLIDEAEADLLLRRSMAQSERLASVVNDLKRYGYTFDGANGPDQQFRDRVRAMVSLLTGLGEAGLAPQLAGDAVAALRRDYGPVAKDGVKLTSALKRAVRKLLARFPESLVSTATSGAARDAFHSDYRNLVRTAKDAATDWKLWEDLKKLRQSKRGAPTPEGYDDLAAAVIAAAERVEDHPGPLEDAAAHLAALIEGAQETLEIYAARKRTLGVVDYGDMIAGAEAMLARDPAILDAVLGGIDCVVVDEFQDTNPVQFALLNHLIGRAPRVLLVGDAKQAIMAFQGADSRLSTALADRMPEALDPLDRNWRSDPRIMALVNALGPGLFGDSYLPLAPQRDQTGLPALEVVRVPTGRAARAPRARPQHAVAERLRALLNASTQIVDPRTGRTRPVRPADIAVLCRRHSEIDAYAEALRAQGIPVSREEQGWYDAPATAAARHALAYAADPEDRHAALCLATLGPPAMALERALKAELGGKLDAVAPLPALAALSEAAETLPLPAFLRRVIDAADLEVWALGQPEPMAVRADLMRLIAEAEAFAGAPEETAEAAGLHGRGPRSFLGWLANRAARRDADNRPAPEAGAGLGVELVTWHSAKGREWPIVILASLDTRMGERAGALRVEFERFDDPDRILETTGIRHCPAAPVPKGRREAFLEARRPAVLETERCLVYVALTRARDRLILEWPEHALEKDTDPDRPETCAGLLVHEGGLSVMTDCVKVGDTIFPAEVSFGPADIPDPINEGDDEAPPYRPGRVSGSPAAPATAWRRTPSSTASAIDLQWSSDVYGLPIPRADAFEDASARGTALHLAARVMLTRYDRAGALLDATGLAESEVVAIGDQMQALKAWLAARGFDRFHTEIPVQMRNADGSEVNGVIDLLAEGEAGIAILDHKSRAPSEPEKAANLHAAQLMAYAEIVEAVMGKTVSLVAINWLGAGTLSHADCRAEAKRSTSHHSSAHSTISDEAGR